MKKIILFSIVSLVILAPKVTLSQSKSQNLTKKEKNIIHSFVCSEEDYSREDIVSKIDDSYSSISNRKRDSLVDIIMNAQQMPENHKNKMCKE